MASQLSVLFSESDAAWRAEASSYLDSYGFQVVPAADLVEVRELITSHRFDAIVLDAGIPSTDGAAVVRDLSARIDSAIVVTSPRAEEAERILALEAGADVYLVKPFGLRELVAHLRAACRRLDRRRGPGIGRRIARFGEWRVDLAAHRAERPDDGVDLTAGETAILRVLIERPRHVFSRPALLASTRRDDAEVFDRTVDVLVSRLRHKLERDPTRPRYIQTVRGEGYRFSVDVLWDVC